MLASLLKLFTVANTPWSFLRVATRSFCCHLLAEHGCRWMYSTLDPPPWKPPMRCTPTSKSLILLRSTSQVPALASVAHSAHATTCYCSHIRDIKLQPQSLRALLLFTKRWWKEEATEKTLNEGCRTSTGNVVVRQHHHDIRSQHVLQLPCNKVSRYDRWAF